MEPCGEKDTFVVSQETFLNVDEGVSPPLKARDYKAPHAVCYEEPRIYDMKQHHAPIEMNVVSWKERDRLAQPRVNITDPVAASDYKGPSFIGYMEKDNEALCVQMANTSSNGSNINHDVSATLAKNNTLAVAYRDEHES